MKLALEIGLDIAITVAPALYWFCVGVDNAFGRLVLVESNGFSRPFGRVPDHTLQKLIGGDSIRMYTIRMSPDHTKVDPDI